MTQKKTTAVNSYSIGLLALISVLFFGLIAAVFLVQQSQDIRDRAAITGGATNIQLAPGSATLAANGDTPIEIRFNTGDIAVDGVQVIATLTPNTQGDITFTPSLPSELTAVANSSFIYDQIANTYQLKFAAVTTDPQTTYTTSSNDVTIGTFSVNFPNDATLTVAFDTLLSRVAESQTAADVLSIPSNQTYAFSDGIVVEDGGQPTDPPTGGGCTAPGAPTNLTATTVGTNAVTLDWTTGSNTDYYFVNYGLEQGQYQWGAPNVGNGNQYTVGGLVPNTVYYFAVAGVNGCSTSYLVEVAGRTAVRATATGYTPTATTAAAQPTLPPNTPKGGSPNAPSYQFGTPRSATTSAKDYLTSPTPRPTADFSGRKEESDTNEKGFFSSFGPAPFLFAGLIVFFIFLLYVRSRRKKKTWHVPGDITGRGPTPTVNQ